MRCRYRGPLQVTESVNNLQRWNARCEFDVVIPQEPVPLGKYKCSYAWPKLDEGLLATDAGGGTGSDRTARKSSGLSLWLGRF
jgi:hypothetical protein